jgi:N,N'-diacetyllegionaminate synthase
MQLNKNSDKVYIIAEIGINHEGDVEKCAKMIKLAAEAGVNAVKLQTIDADENYVEDSESYNIFKGSELSRDETANMFKLARSLGLGIFSTAGDVKTVEWLEILNPDFWKISSGLMTHIPLVKHLAKLGRPMLISTGLVGSEEIDLTVNTVREEGNEQIVLFQCTSLYPTPPEMLNLAAIPWMKERYGVEVGFSDHSIGIDACFLAVGVGATLIEKHFTLDSCMPGYDHKISLEPDELNKLVRRVRFAEKMLGETQKILPQEIIPARDKYLRTIVALSAINIGESFTELNTGVKRTTPESRGSDPIYMDQIIGSRAKKRYKTNQPITLENMR